MAKSPAPATATSAPSWSKRPGPTSIGPTSAPASRPASKDSHPRSPRPWNAQLRLSSRFRQLGTRKNIRSVVAGLFEFRMTHLGRDAACAQIDDLAEKFHGDRKAMFYGAPAPDRL